ncbi:MAG TPA: phage holin family protein [Steroidobacteraceae bacterium]|nr:phage holin family protein [Steroidobacteraceae bacterium]
MADDFPELGLFASLRRMLAALIALAHTRLELVSVEIEEQIGYAAGVLLWSITAIFFGSLAVLLLALTIVIAFWDDHRLLAAGLVTGAFALVAVIAVLTVRARLHRRPRFLGATVDEMKRDVASLEGKST